MRRHVVALLGVLCLMLAAALAALWFDASGRLRGLHWQPPAPRAPDFGNMAPALSSQTSAAASQFSATLERPLFSPTRRPPPAKVAVVSTPEAPPPAPDPLANVQIVGLYEGAKSGGIIARVAGKARRLALNERIGDWTFSAIRGNEVTFSKGSETRVLRLEFKKPSASDANAAASLPGAPAASTASPVASTVSNAVSDRQRFEDEKRAQLKRLNETRARMGLPPFTE